MFSNIVLTFSMLNDPECVYGVALSTLHCRKQQVKVSAEVVNFFVSVNRAGCQLDLRFFLIRLRTIRCFMNTTAFRNKSSLLRHDLFSLICLDVA